MTFSKHDRRGAPKCGDPGESLESCACGVDTNGSVIPACQWVVQNEGTKILGNVQMPQT